LKLFEVDDETIDDALVDRSPDIDVELIGVKWIDGNVEKFREALLTKLRDVKVELLGATLLSGVKDTWKSTRYNCYKCKGRGGAHQTREGIYQDT